MRLSSREVIETLTLREWATLTSMIDYFGPEQVQCYRHGGVPVAGKLVTCKFDVIKVRRENGKIGVFVDFGRGVLSWYELTEKKIHVTQPGDTPQEVCA